MILDHTHPEDVKAAIRKEFGTITKFIEVNSLPSTGVSDLLRGRTSKRVRDAVEKVLDGQKRSIELDSNKPKATAHRLIAGAK